MKQFACGDVVPGCQKIFQATDVDGILRQVEEHAFADHGLKEIPSSLVVAVQQKITDQPVNR